MAKFRLIKEGIEEAVEYFGGLFDEVPVVRGELPKESLLPVRDHGIMLRPAEFDEAAYDLKYQRPPGKWNDPEVKKHSRRKQHAKVLSGKDGYDSLGDKIVTDAERAWDEANPPPFPDIRRKDMTREQNAAHQAHIDRRRWELLTPLQQEGERVGIRMAQRERNANRTPEQIQADNDYQKEYREKNKEDLAIKQRERMQDPERIQRRRDYERERVANMSDEELERYRSQNSAAARRRRQEAVDNGTIHLIRAEEAYRAAMRRRGIEEATPWHSDEGLVREFYDIAGEMGALTGEPHHVHHAIPLNATFPGRRKRSASGLNTQDNLMVIPGKENVRLNSRFEPGDVPEGTGIEAARGLLYETMKELGMTE